MKKSKEGGSRATIFILVMMGLENIGFVANMVSLVLYFLFVMQFDLSASATTTTNFLGTACMLTLVGGFISDTYMNRLNTCLVFGALELLGYTLLIIQSHYKSLQPEPCSGSTCVKGGEALMLYATIGLLALGCGGTRGSVPALGADQFDQENPDVEKKLARYFNYYMLSTTVGGSIGVTLVVWVSTHKGWDRSFMVSMFCSLLGFIVIALGRSYYRVRIPGDSALLRVLQVFVVMVKNRREPLPENTKDLYEIHDQESGLEGRIMHTDQFRVLDKAAILRCDCKKGRWSVCTVTQVEQVKILARMIPIILSSILPYTCLAQLQTLSIQQGILMNNTVGSLTIPASSIPAIPLVSMSILIPIYEFVCIPATRKLTGHPNGITHLQRVGAGLFLSAISMVIAGVIEVKRKHEEVHHGMQISILWLSFQYAIFGLAEVFAFAGLMDFFYSEAPAGMKSVATSFTWLSLSMGYFLSSVLVKIMNSVTSKITRSKRGWLEGRDMNANHVELFYWFLCVLSAINFVHYLYWANWYSYKTEVPTMSYDKPLKPSSHNKDLK